MTQWIIAGAASLATIAVFWIAWRLGSKSTEDSIARKGLEDVNEHYHKMAEDFKEVDSVVDHAKSLLGGVPDDADRSAKVSKAKRAKGGRKAKIKPRRTKRKR
jgi:hypothetical protein|tara:strand:- start:374 stop:682 length:309 start_codon:yes stop_codon:yes gene_type:complete